VVVPFQFSHNINGCIETYSQFKCHLGCTCKRGSTLKVKLINNVGLSSTYLPQIEYLFYKNYNFEP